MDDPNEKPYKGNPPWRTKNAASVRRIKAHNRLRQLMRWLATDRSKSEGDATARQWLANKGTS